MSVVVLDGEKLYHSFVSGANEVVQQRKVLNEINVFPVPDGDTGTNLASTMHNIMEEASPQPTARGTLRSIADAALTGARGNSGIIFAQYVSGLVANTADKAEISVREFAESVRSAVPYAYQAIAHPVEGTMITVIRDWAEAVYALRDSAGDFIELLSHSLQAAAKSVMETPARLKVLADAGVVDSGAKGFMHFIEGFTAFLRTGVPARPTDDARDLEVSAYVEHDAANLTWRYCTEALVEAGGIDLARLRAELEPLGDSLIVAGSETKARLHIHTNAPQDVFYRLRRYGKILQQKVDDMRRQFEAAHERKYPIALVTDSIADLPQEFIDAHQIHVVPLYLMLEDSSYLDKVTIQPEQFYTLMDEVTEYPTSAQPTERTVENLFSFLTTHYASVIAVTVSREMSGTNAVFVRAAERLNSQGARISVVNSRLNSGGEGLVVMRAAEAIAAGRTHDEVLAEIERVIPNTEIMVAVQTLKYMVRAGRVNKVTGIIGRLLNLTPVISIDAAGKGIIKHKALSVAGATKQIFADVRAAVEAGGVERYAIVHARAPRLVEEWRRALVKLTGHEPAYIMDISTIVAMNAGLGTVAVAVIKQ